ncbi:hypothetical protein K435DRAFT_857993 [Dendrothele bispora CBS 962.96]|uniref:Uncharacterized protein n=1 Tax=Dendrothele bispora (strain CBS 962.96) TaxID=1314807 RepID=A0A4S8M5D9_DENBC|nr:hypothetical protein K435DRAFT_857993 [Dendrothele bispora CBS 962.96]
MNFTTCNYAVSLFPISSFVSRTSLVNGNEGEDASIALKKYMDHGWEMLKVPVYTAYGSLHPFDDIHEGLVVNCWSVSIANEGRSSNYFEIGEVDGWKPCCVARQIMVSGLIDKTRTSSADWLDITGGLPKRYSDDLGVSSRLLQALKNVDLTGVPNVFLLDCLREEICDVVQLVGKMSNIKYGLVGSSKGGLEVILSLGRGLSAGKRMELTEWYESVWGEVCWGVFRVSFTNMDYLNEIL